MIPLVLHQLRRCKAIDTYWAFVMCREPDMDHLIYYIPLARKLRLTEIT